MPFRSNKSILFRTHFGVLSFEVYRLILTILKHGNASILWLKNCFNLPNFCWSISRILKSSIIYNACTLISPMTPYECNKQAILSDWSGLLDHLHFSSKSTKFPLPVRSSFLLRTRVTRCAIPLKITSYPSVIKLVLHGLCSQPWTRWKQH